MRAKMNAARRPQGNEDPQDPFIPDFSEGAETGLYLALLELLDEGLIITGDELILDANSAACRLLERDYRQIAGKPLSDLFPSVDLDERVAAQRPYQPHARQQPRFPDGSIADH
jgi:PAS domain-containing protein